MMDKPLPGLAKFRKDWSRFEAWLKAHGSEILAPSNPFEVARFTTPDGVGVVYRNGSGALSSWTGGADVAWRAFSTGAAWAAGVRKARGRARHRIEALKARDGEECWYCGRALGEDVTVEHLVAIAHGGPDHVSNLVLAHHDCNSEAGHMSVAEKVRLRERRRAECGRPSPTASSATCGPAPTAARPTGSSPTT